MLFSAVRPPFEYPTGNYNMGLKAFNKDLTAAGDAAAAGTIPGVVSIKRGSSDGEVAIVFIHENLPSPLRIQAAIEGGTYTPLCDLTSFLSCPDTQLTRGLRCQRVPGGDNIHGICRYR